MARINYIEICGKLYPLSFSLMAQKTLAAKHGSIEELQEKITNLDEAGIDALVDFIEILVKQGCAYKNMFERDCIIPDGAAVVNGEWMPPEREEIMVGIQFGDLTKIIKEITGTIMKSSEREVVAEIKEEKNAKPTQE